MLLTPYRFRGVTPTQVSGLVAWWHFQDRATIFSDDAGTVLANDGDTVGFLSDKSGSGNHLVQATAGNRGTFYAKPFGGCIQFNKSHWLGKTGVSLSNPSTVICTAWIPRNTFIEDDTTQTFSPIAILANGANASAAGSIGLASNNAAADERYNPCMFGGAATSSTGVLVGANRPLMFTANFAGASSIFYMNGAQVATGNYGNTAMTGFSLGAASGGSFPSKSIMMQCLVFNKTLSAQELADMHYYMWQTSLFTNKKIIAFRGDSQPFGAYGTAFGGHYPLIFAKTAAEAWTIYSDAVPGWRIDQITAAVAGANTFLGTGYPAARVSCIEGGGNDAVGGASEATMISRAQAEAAALTGANLKKIISNIHGFNASGWDSTKWASWIAQVNANYASWGYNARVDFSLRAAFDEFTDYNNADGPVIYKPDEAHLFDLGYGEKAAAFREVIEALPF